MHVQYFIIGSDEAAAGKLLAALHSFAPTAQAAESAPSMHSPNTIYLLCDSEIQKNKATIHALFDRGATNMHICLVGTSQSLPLRILQTELGLMSFLFENEIDTATLQNFLQSIQEKYFSTLIQAEIATAMESGALALLEQQYKVDTKQCMERARVAGAFALSLHMDVTALQRILRFALFYDLSQNTDWKKIVQQSRRLWIIQELLEKKPKQAIWPVETSEELAIVECAQLIVHNYSQGEIEVRRQLKEASTALSFKFRTSLRLSADRILSTLWERRRDVA